MLLLASLALLVGACATPSGSPGDESETGDGDGDSSGDGDGDGDGDGSETSTDGETGDDSWGADEEGDPTASCPDVGSPCGPEPSPCTVELELQFAVIGSASSPPAVAVGAGCRPHVFANVAVQGFHGFYATWDDGWQIEETPMPVARGGLVVDPQTQVPTLMAYDGAFGLSTWVRDPDWQQLASFEGMTYYDGALARDGDGLLHTGYRYYMGASHYGSFDGDQWSTVELVGPTDGLDVAVSMAGAPHVSSWSNATTDRELYWQTPDVGPELVATYPDGPSGYIEHTLVVTGGDDVDPLGTPHLIHQAFEPDGVAYSTRSGPATWTSTTIVSDETTELCAYDPVEDGETCDYDYVRHKALAIVANADGELRMLWSRIHHLGTLTSVCEAFPGSETCSWGRSDASVGELWVGWPEGDSVGAALVGPSLADLGAADLDSSGRIHVVVYDRNPYETERTVRYLLIGP